MYWLFFNSSTLFPFRLQCHVHKICTKRNKIHSFPFNFSFSHREIPRITFINREPQRDSRSSRTHTPHPALCVPISDGWRVLSLTHSPSPFISAPLLVLTTQGQLSARVRLGLGIKSLSALLAIVSRGGIRGSLDQNGTRGGYPSTRDRRHRGT